MTASFATEIVRAGIAVIPIQYRDKRPEHRLLPIGDDGSPSWEIYKTRLPSEQDVQRWLGYSPNYGVVCGWRGLLVLDFDEAAEYSRWRLWAAQHARFVAENAFQVQTNRGVHVYLRSETPGANRKIGKIDIKYRGYVLGPGSVHPSGASYRALKAALVLPLIASLTDVLPAELLVQQSLPSQVRPMATTPTADPWQTAMQAQPAVGMGAVEKIKQSLRIEDLFNSLTPTSHDGRWFLTQCPFHDDRHPSFWVDTQQQICGCFAGCTPKPLDVIGLHARLYGLSNGEAIRLLGSHL